MQPLLYYLNIASSVISAFLRVASKRVSHQRGFEEAFHLWILSDSSLAILLYTIEKLFNAIAASDSGCTNACSGEQLLCFWSELAYAGLDIIAKCLHTF